MLCCRGWGWGLLGNGQETPGQTEASPAEMPDSRSFGWHQYHEMEDSSDREAEGFWELGW